MAGLLTGTGTAALPIERRAEGGDPVARTLQRWAVEPFDWCRDNCGLRVIAYLEDVLARPLPGERPWFVGPAHVRRSLREAGGFDVYASEIAGRFGLLRTRRPLRGDVGLAEMPEHGLIAAICTGPLWAARGAGGVIAMPTFARVAWSVPQARGGR